MKIQALCMIIGAIILIYYFAYRHFHNRSKRDSSGSLVITKTYILWYLYMN